MDLSADANNDIDEEAVIESLFTGCDAQGNGLVKVSKLVEYLSAVAGDNVEFGGNFDELVTALDPKGNDREVDLETCRKGMLQWIEEIRCRDDREEVYYSDTSLENRPAARSRESIDRSGDEDSRFVNVTSESVEGLGGESPLKQDWELVTKIEDLQLNNKRLVDHNVELSFQMENTEESNNQLLKEVDNLRRQVRSYQKLDEKKKSIERENEELRQTVADLQETSHVFQTKAKQLEKDRVMLSEFQEELQSKLSAAHRTLESLSKDHQNVCLAYNEEKQRLIELEELQDVKDEMDEESTGTQEYLTSIISNLTTQKETLQLERNKMEAELYQVREDLNRLMVRNASTFSSTERNKLMRHTAKFGTTGSTLQQELQEIAIDDCLPSPIVGYSPSSYQNSSYENDVFDSPKSLTSPLSLVSLNSSSNSPLSKSNEYFAAVSQVAADFREKKEKALQTISELVSLEKTRENREIRESLQRDLEKEMEFFAEKIWLLSLARKASEKRVSKLLALIESLKDENHCLQDERDKALQKIGNLSLGNEDMETKIEELASELETSLENTKHLQKQCTDLKNKLMDKETELQRIKKEALSSSPEDAGGEFASKYHELERKHKELEEEHRKALAKLSKVELELEKTAMDLAVENKRSRNLQESLSLSVSKHEQELQDIMETIPSEACDNSHSRTKSSAITGYQVRNKLRAFLVSRCLTIRDSPDGKPNNRKGDVPLGVSTPIDGNSFDSNCISNRQKSFDTPFPNKEVENCDSTEMCDKSPGSLGSSSNQCDDGSALSSISPNLIRPFDVQNDRWISPNLIEPFEGDSAKNKTFTKPDHSTELREWDKYRETCGRDKEALGNPHDFTETKNATCISPGSSDDCAKNLLTDFYAEETRNTNHSSCCTCSGGLSDVHPFDGDSAPTSPTIPSRFRKISNITPPCGLRKSVAGSQPVPASSNEKDRNSPCGQNLTTNSENTNEDKLVFTFDGPPAEIYTNRNENSRTRSRLTNSSREGDRLSDIDSDYKSSPVQANSYILGVSLNSSLPSDEKELEKLFKSVCLAFRTDKDSLPQRLEYQERARNGAEDNIMKTLNTLSNVIKTFEENAKRDTNKKNIKDILSSLHHQVGALKDCSRRVSSQSHQYGSYQQEARMMSGIDVLINYGERLSLRLETLADTIAVQELQNQTHHREESNEDARSKAETSDLTRRGSSFYNFVSSIRVNDSFRLFGSSRDSEVRETYEQELNAAPKLEKQTAAAYGDTIDDAAERENKEKLVSRRPTSMAKQRSCFGRCLCCSIKLTAFAFLFMMLFYVLVQYSVFDRYFIMNKLRDFVKNQRFETLYYEHEPAV
ncbi:lymphoid-restricted membrane protein-like isoform X2 [Dendronephthya gigantea]|uniref:lymphoid-restricted membrane protein-like isoform X2 n=1 Tax=Dendronephthya gigantea TaxID=151771 RepID=UPI00106D2BE7|nr:lymphoid-restricted membrane protein-like isoform X2 [Dendronephthya gigantea]